MARVTGAPATSSSGNGTISDMCWTMCALKLIRP